MSKRLKSTDKRTSPASFATRESPSLGPIKGQSLSRIEQPTALDLYCGVGGWSLGLQLAGIGVIRAFERWKPALDTYNANFGTHFRRCDMRLLENKKLPKPGDVDFVVGSPPCTEFSLSNRGGGGDIPQGLADVECFLRVVAYLRPRYWVLENVPRVSGIVARESSPGGKLEPYAHLIKVNTVLKMDEFGLPQGRRRCLIGDFPIDLLRSYRAKSKVLTLRSVVASLSRSEPMDCNYGQLVPGRLTDHEKELPLSAEEILLNKAAKSHHPVYNKMSFPDDLDRPSRTVTATCTRVSRESIVIQDAESYRRLTVRERAVLQGFPLQFNFFGKTYSEKLRLVGNAMPPPFAFFIAQALLETETERVRTCGESGYIHPRPARRVPATAVDLAGSKFRPNRTFRFAVPHLNFGSGVRFELANLLSDGATSWVVRFVYGTSKNIKEFVPNETHINHLLESPGVASMLETATRAMLVQAWECDAGELQLAWSRRSEASSPVLLLDVLGLAAQELIGVTDTIPEEYTSQLLAETLPALNPGVLLRRRAPVVAGLALAAYWNSRSGLAPY